MMLKSISYVGNYKKKTEWSCGTLNLQDVNLIVGYNATGKTRTINSLRTIAGLLSGEIRLKTSSESFKIVLEEGSVKYLYEIDIVNGEIERESLYRNEKCLLFRNNSDANYIYSENLEDNLEFSIENNILAVIGKRDKIHHPFLEELVEWGKYVFYYPFGSDMGRTSLLIANYDDDDMNYSSEVKATRINPKSHRAVVGYLKDGLEVFGESLKLEIIEQMNMIGYDIEDIGVEYLNVEVDDSDRIPQSIFIKEKDLIDITFQNRISQGMFRALSIIIHTTLSVNMGLANLILIDDIGEGLDFNRSTSLIKLLTKKAQESNIQLIMSTNDRFVMNNVELKYWQVIKRVKGNCKYYNISNSKELFEEFEFIGLSNFDFLSSGFFEEFEEAKL